MDFLQSKITTQQKMIGVVQRYIKSRKNRIKDRKALENSYQRELDLFNVVGERTTLTHQHILNLLGKAEQEIWQKRNDGTVLPPDVNVSDKHYRFCAIGGENDNSLDQSLADLINDFQEDRDNDRVSIVLCRGRIVDNREIVGNTHWTTLHLRKNAYGEVTAYHFNSSGNEVPVSVRRVVHDHFGIPLVQKDAPQQDDVYSCGYHAFYNALRANQAASLEAERLNNPNFGGRNNIAPADFLHQVREGLQAEFNNRTDRALTTGRTQLQTQTDAGRTKDVLIRELAEGQITPLAKAIMESVLIAPARNLTPFSKMAQIKQIQTQLNPRDAKDIEYFKNIYKKLIQELIEARRNDIRNETATVKRQAEEFFDVISTDEFTNYLFNARVENIEELENGDRAAFTAGGYLGLNDFITGCRTRAGLTVPVVRGINDVNQELLAAIRAGQNDRIQRLLDDGAKAFCCDDQKKSALLLAVESGNDFAANLLLLHGAQVNVMSDTRDNPLLAACRNNESSSVAMVESLAQFANLAILQQSQKYLQNNTNENNRIFNERKLSFILDAITKTRVALPDTDQFKESTNNVLMQFRHLLEEIRLAPDAVAVPAAVGPAPVRDAIRIEKSNQAKEFCLPRFPDEQAKMLEMLVESYLQSGRNADYCNALFPILTTLIEQGALQNAEATANRIADMILAAVPANVSTRLPADIIFEGLLHISGRTSLSFKAFDVFVRKFGLVGASDAGNDLGTITRTLHHAVDNNNLEVLASALASPNCTQAQKDALLLYAIKKRNYFAIDKCVEFGANILTSQVSFVPQNLRTLDNAQIARGGDYNLLQFIPQGRQKEIKAKAFINCVWNDNPEVYRALLLRDDPALVNFRSDKDHVLAQAIKASKQRPQAATFITNLIAQPNFYWEEVDAPILHNAAAYGSTVILQALLNNAQTRTPAGVVNLALCANLQEKFDGKNVFDFIKEQETLQRGNAPALAALQENRNILYNSAIAALGQLAARQPAILDNYTIGNAGGNMRFRLGGVDITDNAETEKLIFATYNRYIDSRFNAVVTPMRNALTAYFNRVVNDNAPIVPDDIFNQIRLIAGSQGAITSEIRAAQEYALCHMLTERNKLAAANNNKKKLERTDQFIHEFLLKAQAEYHSLYSPQINLLTGAPVPGTNIIDLVTDPKFKRKLRSDHLFALAMKGKDRYQRLKEAIEVDKEIMDVPQDPIRDQDRDFKTALDIVLEKGDVESARLLVATTSNHSLSYADVVSKTKVSPLEKAIDRGDVEAVKFLIEAQAEIFKPKGAADEYDCWALRYVEDKPAINTNPPVGFTEPVKTLITELLRQEALKEIYQAGKTVLHTQHPNGWMEEDDSLTVGDKKIRVRENQFGHITYEIIDPTTAVASIPTPDEIRQLSQTVWRQEKALEKKLAKEFNGILERIIDKPNDAASKADLHNFLMQYQGEEKILTMAFACVIGQLNADKLRQTTIPEAFKYWFSPFYTSINRVENLKTQQANALKEVAKEIIDIGRIEVTMQWQDKPHQRSFYEFRAKKRDAILRAKKPHGMLPLIKFIDDKYEGLRKELANHAMLTTANSYSLNAPYFRELGYNSADITSQDKKGRNALHLAFETGNLEIIEEVAKRDDSVIQILLNQRDHEGATPLMVAARYNQAKAIEFFCNHVKDPARFLNNPEFRGIGGMTPLMVAAACNSLKSVQTLLEFGADKKIPSTIDAIGADGVADGKKIARDFTNQTDLGKDIWRRLSDGRTLERSLTTAIEAAPVEKKLVPQKSHTRNLVCDYGGRIKITADDLQFKTAFADHVVFEGVNFAGNGFRITSEHPNGVIGEMRDRHSFAKLYGRKAAEFMDNFRMPLSPESKKLYKGYFQPYHSQFYRKDFEDINDKKIFGTGSYLFMSYFNDCTFGNGRDKFVDLSGVIDPWADEMQKKLNRRETYFDENGRRQLYNQDEIDDKKFAIIRSLRFHNCDMRGIVWPRDRDERIVLPNLITFASNEEGVKKYANFIAILEGLRGAPGSENYAYYNRYIAEYEAQNTALHEAHAKLQREAYTVREHLTEDSHFMSLKPGRNWNGAIREVRPENPNRAEELLMMRTAPGPDAGRRRIGEFREERINATRLARRVPGRNRSGDTINDDTMSEGELNS